MAKKLLMELANFTLRFGEKYVLLDFLEDIVLPAFTEVRERQSHGSSYLFHNVRLVNAGRDGADFPAIAGRVVKITTIERQQFYDRTERILVAQPILLESSPSSFFVLILDGHKLLYVKEHKGSPDISMFASATERFLNEAYEEFVNRRYAESRADKDSKNKTTKTSLREAIPKPTLEVIEISTKRNFTEFVKSFGIIQQAQMRLIRTNDETSHDDFLELAQRRAEAAKAKSTTIQQQSPDGLDKEQVILQFGEALDGSFDIKLVGKDEFDNKQDGDNSKFNYRVNLGIDSLDKEKVADEAISLINKYYELVDSGRILPTAIKQKHREILSKVARARFVDK